MDALTQSWVQATQKAVNSLYEKYKINKGMLLTEGDLQCYLFHELMQQDGIRGYHPSKNTSKYNKLRGEDYKTGFVHSEVTWFQQGKKSGFEVDLTICDPRHLEVINLELFEAYTHKGFAHDGPCVAVEVKFIRKAEDARGLSHADLLKFRDELIPAKLENINKGVYEISNPNNIAFISVVGCKSKDIFDLAKVYIGTHFSDKSKTSPENLFVYLFCQDDFLWNKAKFIEAYEEKRPGIEKRQKENELRRAEYLAEARKRKAEKKIKKLL